MSPVSLSISGTTAVASGSGTRDFASSSGQGNISSSGPTAAMPSLFGELPDTVPMASEASNAVSSETKGRSSRQSLSDRLTPSLITAGLVRGTTPSWIRKRLGAPILGSALWPLGGSDAE